MTDIAMPAPVRPSTAEDAAAGRGRWTRLRLPFSPWHLVLIPVTFILIVPLLWMLITSLETEGETVLPPVLLPEPRFENYPTRGGGTVRTLLRQQRTGALVVC
jgi:multiple sugar transport system permease protein